MWLGTLSCFLCSFLVTVIGYLKLLSTKALKMLISLNGYIEEPLTHLSILGHWSLIYTDSDVSFSYPLKDAVVPVTQVAWETQLKALKESSRELLSDSLI